MKKIYALIAGLALGISAQAQLQNFAVGDEAPNFTQIDTHGNTHNLYTYTDAGKYVLIDFFAYWCGPCMSTAPFIDAFYKKYGCNSVNVIVLGNESDPAGTLAQLESFDSQAGISSEDSYPSWFGTSGGSSIGSTFGPSAYPTIVLIGPDRKFINIDIWPIGSVSAIEAAFPAGVLTPSPCITGMEEASIDSFLDVYPNPSQTSLHFKLTTNGVEEITANVYDMTGQLVRSEIITNSGSQTHTIATSDLANGNYMMRLNGTSTHAGRMFNVLH